MQRVSQVILHSSGVYVCVYMCIYPYASPLEYTIPFKNVPHVWLCRPLLSLLFVPPSPVDLDSDYNVLVDPTEDKMSRTYQIKTDISSV